MIEYKDNCVWLMHHGVHLCNFNYDQLEELIDWDALLELPKTKRSEKAVRLLSQYLVGNCSGTAEELMAMDAHDRSEVLWTWVELVKDPDESRHIAKYVVNLYANR